MRRFHTNPFIFWYRKYEKLNAAKASVSADRDEKIEQAADSIERDLILLGATAVEDKLQQGVCRRAGEAPTAEIFIKRGKKKNCTNQSGKMPNSGSRPKKAKQI